SAGHEMPFYPGYYPQEIRIETLTPSAAASLLAKSKLHAYVGEDPWAGRTPPGNIGTAESLASYLVITFNPASPAASTRERRCESAAGIIKALPAKAGYVLQAYPVTPFHADY